MGQTRHLERKREARQKGELEKLRESIQKDRKRGSANLFSFPSSCFVSLPGHPPPVPGLSSTTVFSFPGDRLWQVRRALTVGIYRCYDAHSINGFFPRRLEGCFSGAFYVPLLGGGGPSRLQLLAVSRCNCNALPALHCIYLPASAGFLYQTPSGYPFPYLRVASCSRTNSSALHRRDRNILRLPAPTIKVLVPASDASRRRIFGNNSNKMDKKAWYMESTIRYFPAAPIIIGLLL